MDTTLEDNMSLNYIRSCYLVPALLGGRVIAYGKFGTITGADGAHLKIQLDGDKMSGIYHPIDGIEYKRRLNHKENAHDLSVAH